jgi:hypothetical protein
MNHQSFDISVMLQRMIASVDVTADEREYQDTDIIVASFASGRTKRATRRDLSVERTPFIDYARGFVRMMKRKDRYERRNLLGESRSDWCNRQRCHWRTPIV